ncbi:932_t:CDS:2 [Funneliformis mosseae]|uniref:932_t:CDS:1 n=1 Tax=Funneliformis mosseae TaxID=27381 RepID=A0A9N9HW40_FUNMO|nr:932_t:CDS:2 [Funneliformis mosseae]
MHCHASILKNNDSLVSQQNTQPILNILASQNNITKTLCTTSASQNNTTNTFHISPASGTSDSQQNTSHYILTLKECMLWASDFTKIIDDNKSNVPVYNITRNTLMELIDYPHEEITRSREEVERWKKKTHFWQKQHGIIIKQIKSVRDDAEMKEILKTLPNNFEMKYDQVFNSSDNKRIWQQLVPEILRSLRSRYNPLYNQLKKISEYHSSEESETDQKNDEGKYQIVVYDYFWRSNEHALLQQLAQLTRPQIYDDICFCKNVLSLKNATEEEHIFSESSTTGMIKGVILQNEQNEDVLQYDDTLQGDDNYDNIP